MYLGVPVIATEAAGNLDLITDGENGLFFQDGDIKQLASNIDRIRDDEALKSRLIKNAFQTASVDFSIENTLDGYENLFRSLIST